MLNLQIIMMTRKVYLSIFQKTHYKDQPTIQTTKTYINLRRTIIMNLRKLLALVLAMALIFSSVTIAGAESFYSDARYSSAGAASEVSDSPSSDDVGGDNGSAEQTPGEGDEAGLPDDSEESGNKEDEDYEQDTGSDEDTDADVGY